jgi:bifunctional UDP-N-acetylglucosamine pyrophosphorylase/glucosamine-1-phosphate N-acetyltransferase
MLLFGLQTMSLIFLDLMRAGRNESAHVGGKPLVAYTVDTLEHIGLSKEQICLVVGFHAEKVRDYFGDRVHYAEQTELKGTAHAAFTGMQTLPGQIKHVLVLGGDDSAFYTAETISQFIDTHVSSNCVLSLLSAHVDHPAQLGRTVRRDNGDIEIIEKEYLTEEQKLITEISTGTFCFDRAWFESIFPRMPMLRKLGEYGLPTALAMARDEKKQYQVITLKNSNEWYGVNTPEELVEARKRKISN